MRKKEKERHKTLNALSEHNTKNIDSLYLSIRQMVELFIQDLKYGAY